MHAPSSRYTVQDIKQHRWFVKKFQKVGSTERHIRPDEIDSKQVSGDENLTRFCLSQPELPGVENATAIQINLEERPGFSFSQPAHIEDLLLCTQANPYTQASQQNSLQRLARRMTRFFVKTECEATVKRLVSYLEAESYSYRINDFGIITITTMDRRKMPLVFKANIIEMDGKILVDFRLSKGCGLEFKRRFLNIKSALQDIVLKGAVTWPIIAAAECRN